MTYAEKQAKTAKAVDSHNYLWWSGQIVALMLTMWLLWHGYSGPVAAAVGYALALLVDIREAVSRGIGDG